MTDPHCECESDEFQAKLRQGMLDDDEIMELADLFKLFGDSTRLRILWALHESEMCVQGLSKAVGMSASAVSHQLKSLKNADLIKSRRDGKNIYYSLCDEHVQSLLNIALEHINEE